jgi:hypothetical protein
MEQCGEGSASVAELELDLRIELGHGAVLVGKIEERIVAETAGPAWGWEDLACDGAVGDAEDLAVAGGGEDAVVAGFRVAGVESGEGLLEAEIVALVEGSGGRAGEVFVVGIAGGADTGGSVEGVDLEAGVVGDDDLAVEVVGVVDGLDAGVAFEGGFVFGRRGDVVEVGERLDGDLLGGGGVEVAELAGVGGGDEELHVSIDIPFLSLNIFRSRAEFRVDENRQRQRALWLGWNMG